MGNCQGLTATLSPTRLEERPNVVAFGRKSDLNDRLDESTDQSEGGQSTNTTDWKKDIDDRLDELTNYVENNTTFKTSLLDSLKKASKSARCDLDGNLYVVLQKTAKSSGWPTDIDEYKKFLRAFASYAPRQSDHPGWVGAVKGASIGSDEYMRSHQEVYDRLCHFYFLINDVQNDSWFAKWLVRYAQVWGKFCDSPESISPEAIYSFYKLSPKYEVTDSMIPMNEEDIPKVLPKFTIINKDGKPMISNNPSGWNTWNQFFARELNPGLRPITSPELNSIVCAPADCTFRQKYAITEDNKVVGVDRLKRTHQIGNIRMLLTGLDSEEKFAGGTFVHYFLGPYSYHRFHAPVAGKVIASKTIPGKTFLNVEIKNGQFDAPDNSEDGDGYEFTQARGVLIIDTEGSPYGDIGLVAVIPVGMCQVSGVRMIATEGTHLQKGDEFGYFVFGGSDIIMLFQKGIVQNIVGGDQYNKYGTKVIDANS